MQLLGTGCCSTGLMEIDSSTRAALVYFKRSVYFLPFTPNSCTPS